MFSESPLRVFYRLSTDWISSVVFAVVVAWWGHLTSLPLDDRDCMPVIGDSQASVAGDYISLPVVSAVYLGGMSLAERPYMVSRTPETD